MNTKYNKNPTLNEIDRLIIELAWDAEIIAREEGLPIYIFLPSQPSDAAIAARVGATTATTLKSQVIIWRNDCEET